MCAPVLPRAFAVRPRVLDGSIDMQDRDNRLPHSSRRSDVARFEYAVGALDRARRIRSACSAQNTSPLLSLSISVSLSAREGPPLSALAVDASLREYARPYISFTVSVRHADIFARASESVVQRRVSSLLLARSYFLFLFHAVDFEDRFFISHLNRFLRSREFVASRRSILLDDEYRSRLLFILPDFFFMHRLLYLAATSSILLLCQTLLSYRDFNVIMLDMFEYIASRASSPSPFRA